MTTLHHIGELLQSGVRPTEEETEHLRSLGGFVAEMFGRYLAGGRDVLSSGPDSWSSRLSGRLSAANGARWEQGLGLGEMFLASDLTSFWQVAKGGFTEGYGRLDAERSLLDLYEDEVTPQPEVQVESAPRRRRPSLFGAKGAQNSGLSARTQPGKGGRSAKPTGSMRAARWADGGTAEMAVVKALASGGLFVGDQVTSLIAESGEVFSRGTAAPRATQAVAAPLSLGMAGVGSAAPSVALDGVTIDGRTPALASALARAEAVFGRGDAMVKPAVAASRMDKLASIVPFSMDGVDRGYGLGERPVYGFYDAAETTYVNLPSDAAPVAGNETERLEMSGSVRTGRSARRLGLPPSARAQRQAGSAGSTAHEVARQKPTSSQARGANRQALTLDSLVRPVAPAPGIAPLRPLTAAALGGQDVSVASKVVFTPGGTAVPQVQRGGAFAPRISVTQLASAGMDMPFASVAPAAFDAVTGQVVAQPGAVGQHGQQAPAAIGQGTAGFAGQFAEQMGRPMSQASMRAAQFQQLQAKVGGARGAASAAATSSTESQATRTGSPVWRLAADAGPDLPVGAGFTGPEIFSVLAGARGGRELRQTGVDFKPAIAADTRGVSASGGASASGGTRPVASRLAGLVDGLVWVSLPVDGQAASAAADLRDPLDGMGLASVPTGRRTAMVPAQVALDAIAARSAESGRAQAMRLAAGVDGPVAGDVARLVAGGAGATRDAIMGAGRESGVNAPQHEGLRRAESAAVERRIELATGTAALGMGFVPQIARTLVDTSGAAEGGSMGSPAEQGTIGGMFASRAGAPGFVQSAPGGSGVLAGRGLEALESGDRAATNVFAGGPQAVSGVSRVGERLARMVEGAVGSGYGRLDAERVMLAAMSSETSPAMAGADAEVPTVSRGFGRRLAGRIDRGVAAGQVQQSASTSPVQHAALAARQALLRPVPTAREARAVAAAFSSRGVVGGAVGQYAVSGPLATGSDEPVLGRIVAARTEAGGQLAGAVSRWESSPELMARIASLEGGARRELGQSLRQAGWSEAELQMLKLEPREAFSTEAGSPGSGALAAERSMARLDAARVNRSFARVMAGAEALGGPIETTASSSGKMASTVAARLAASPMPMLEGRGVGQDYFGSLASSGAPAVGYASLRDELGALVKMAEVVSSQAAEPVAAEAHSGLVARARAVFARTSGAERGAASQLLARIEAVAGRAQSSGRADQAQQLGAIAQSLGSAGIEPRALAPIGSGEAFSGELARIEGAADATTMGFGRVGGVARPMDIDDVEMSVLALEREVTPNLEARLAQALALSTAGPAGARRLLGGAAQSKTGQGAQTARQDGKPARDAVTVESLRAGGERAPKTMVGALGSATQRQLAALVEELGGDLPVSLNKVIAPEAMLQGLRSPELSAAIQTLRSRQHQIGAQMTRVLATLADSGVDLSAARSSLAAVAKEFGATSVERFAAVPTTDEAAGIRGYESTSTVSELAEGSPEQSFLRLVSESVEGGAPVAGSRSLAQVAAMVQRGGLSRSQRAGLLSSLLRGTERAERTSLLEEAGGSDFAFAWLSRVDGTRTGLDIGLGETRQEFGRAFGGRRDSAVSMDSPIGGASLVSPAAASSTAEGAARVAPTSLGGGMSAARGSTGSDKSGLRSLAATVTQTATGAVRPQHGASQAVRRTDWSFVDTGSRASTTHADLGRLASAIVSSSESSQRAPMPLVAPAVKAVAQTALRDSKTSSAPSQPAQGSGGAPTDAGNRGPVDAKMSEKAIEMLAVEMANRVARLMGLMKERIGVWS